MPIVLAVEEPRAGIVCDEPDRDIISWAAHAYDVADDWVVVVVRRVSRAPDDIEVMPMQVDRVLIKKCGRMAISGFC